MNLIFSSLCLLPSLTYALGDLWEFTRRDVPSAGFFDPTSNGGSLLTTVADTSPPGQQEPINIIITANSDAAVLQDATTNGGLQNFFLSLNFSGECLGNHIGDSQQANLGDGNGLKNETSVMRYDYGDPQTGTCEESFRGGNHFRYWIQNGSEAASNAIFIAASYELPSSDNHDIIANGYNLGRDYIVGNMTNQPVPTSSLTNSSTFSGSSAYNGFSYSTSITYVSGLLPNTSVGINHNITVSTSTSNAVDGLVAVLEVKISGQSPFTNGTNGTSSSGDSNGSNSAVSTTWILSLLSIIVPSLLSLLFL